MTVLVKGKIRVQKGFKVTENGNKTLEYITFQENKSGDFILTLTEKEVLNELVLNENVKFISKPSIDYIEGIEGRIELLTQEAIVREMVIAREIVNLDDTIKTVYVQIDEGLNKVLEFNSLEDLKEWSLSNKYKMVTSSSSCEYYNSEKVKAVKEYALFK